MPNAPFSKLSLWKLEVFLEVLKRQSFSRAAQQLQISQPTVSSHIAALEQFFGTQLLDRVGGSIVPTGAGRLLAERAERLLLNAHEAVQSMRSYLGSLEGELRIGGSTIPGTYLLPGPMARFQMNHTSVRIHLQIRPSVRTLDNLSKGRLEMAVIGRPPEGDQFEAIPIAEDRVVLGVRSDHPLANRQMVEPAEIFEHRILFREEDSGTRRLVETRLRNAGIRPLEDLAISCFLGSSEAIREGIRSGLGIGFLSERAIAVDVRRGCMSAIELEGIPLERSFHLVRDRRRTHSPISEAFLTHLQSSLD